MTIIVVREWCHQGSFGVIETGRCRRPPFSPPYKAEEAHDAAALRMHYQRLLNGPRRDDACGLGRAVRARCKVRGAVSCRRGRR